MNISSKNKRMRTVSERRSQVQTRFLPGEYLQSVASLSGVVLASEKCSRRRVCAAACAELRGNPGVGVFLLPLWRGRVGERGQMTWRGFRGRGHAGEKSLRRIQPLLISSYTFTSFLSSSTALLSFPFPLSRGGRVLRHYFLPAPAIVLSADRHFLRVEMPPCSLSTATRLDYKSQC